MTWFAGGAVAILALFALNALYVHRLRARGVLKPRPALTRSLLTRRQSGWQVAGGLAIGVAFVACLAAPTVAPGSALAQAAARPWILACAIPYLMAVASLAAVVGHLWRRRAGRRP